MRRVFHTPFAVDHYTLYGQRVAREHECIESRVIVVSCEHGIVIIEHDNVSRRSGFDTNCHLPARQGTTFLRPCEQFTAYMAVTQRCDIA